MMGSTVLATPEKQKPAAEDKMTADSPFKAYGGAMDDDAHYSDQEPVREDISDGLQIFSAYKRASSWLLPTYTRKDCRCGQCSIGDPDPCPYARPQVQSSLSSMLTSGRRSLSHLLSARDHSLRASKDT